MDESKIGYDLYCALTSAYDDKDDHRHVLTMRDVRGFIDRGYTQELPLTDVGLYELTQRPRFQAALTDLHVEFVNPR